MEVNLSNPAAPLQASVCICTHNGGPKLAAVIDCLTRQTMPQSTWEVIVIDNASTDDTAQVAAALLAPFGAHGRVTPEPEPGLLFARRRAALDARAGIICFLDDDNLAEPDFIERALKVFAEHPRTGSLGGKVIADWLSEPTPLVRTVSRFALAIIDQGDAPFVYDWVADGPVGAGLCIRRDLLHKAIEEVLGSGLALGRQGASLVSGEDMALAVKVAQAGYERRYEPLLRLRHRLPAERMTREYLLRLYEGIGRGETAVRRLWARGGARRSVNLLVAFKELAQWTLGRVRGPRQRARLTSVPWGLSEGNPALRRDLHALEQSLIWGRMVAAFRFAFSNPGQKGVPS